VISKLDRIINQNGENVLVHCRGGIGRAGLVACSWLLSNNYCTSAQEAIAFVRKRRSPKAIETKEQEQFLEHYTEWLNNDRYKV
jgi:protein-tyrosine phosphatase